MRLRPTALLLATTPTQAADGLDVAAWLARPGVKLVAVEFYATWCKPCMDAVPRWKALHERFKDDGLRLVVVNTLDPGGRCKSVGWNPDDMVCDVDGRIARAMGVGDALPAAFLWSWQGNLLVQRGHVDGVEEAAERYLRSSPRVQVDALDEAGKPDLELARLVSAEVAGQGKIVVVADEAERERLRALRKSGNAPGVRDDLACKLGLEVSANSWVEARRLGSGAGKKLTLAMFSVEKGCQEGKPAVVPWNALRPELSVREAAQALLQHVTRAAEMPRPLATPGGRTVVEKDLGGKPREWNPGGANEVVVQLVTTPPGAVVTIDGTMVCRATPCSRALPVGRHTVSAQLEQYVPASKAIDLTEGRTVTLALVADFAEMTFDSVPTGLPLTIDDKPSGVTPLRIRLSPGGHTALVQDRCHHPAGKTMALQRGDVRTETFTAAPRVSAIKVRVRDDSGNDLSGEVFVDGARVGTAPGTFKVPLCSRSVEVRVDTGKTWSDRLALEEEKVADVIAVVVETPSSGVRVGAWTSLGVGVATLGAAVTLQVMATSLRDEIRDAASGGVVDGDVLSQADATDKETRANGLMTGAVVTYSLAAVAAVTSIVLFALPTGPAVTFLPTPDGGGVVLWTGAFR